MKTVVKELTKLPVTVLNSHTHYDHIGGNHEFEQILAMNTTFTKDRAKNGVPHGMVQHEALCLKKIPQLNTAKYRIRPFRITTYVEEGTLIDLGHRKLKVIARVEEAGKRKLCE